MAYVVVTNVSVQNNPCKLLDDFSFEITFEVMDGLPSDAEIEWKLVYVSCPDQKCLEQELDCVCVGPLRVGKNKFVFTAPAPDPTQISTKALLEVNALLLTCSYREREFIRIGYYVNNELEDEEQHQKLMAQLHPPQPESEPGQEPAPAPVPEAKEIENIVVDFNTVRRNILDKKPRVTRFAIPWDDHNESDKFQEFDREEQKRREEMKASGMEDEEMDELAAAAQGNSSGASNGHVVDEEDLEDVEDEDEDEDGMEDETAEIDLQDEDSRPAFALK